MAGNLNGETVHELNIVAYEENQGDGGLGKSVSVDGNPRGESVHQLSNVSSEIKQKDVGPCMRITDEGNSRVKVFIN